MVIFKVSLLVSFTFATVSFTNPLVTTEAVVSVRNLAKHYGDFKAVNGLNFTVNRGDVYGFLGPNGAGKSTTMRMMVSLISPTGGEIDLFGLPLQQNRRAIMKRVGALIERPDFYKHLSAFRNLELLARVSELKIDKQRVYDLLELVGLKGRERDPVRAYSQGMKQRLGLAQALLHDPELLILDEPTNGLDPQGIHEIRELILKLNRERNITFIISSHLLYEIEQIATRMVIINKGTAVVEGSVTDLLNDIDVTVTFEVTHPDKAKQIIHQAVNLSNELIVVDGTNVEARLHRSQIPLATKALVEAGIDIRSIKPVRSLEQYFLSLT